MGVTNSPVTSAGKSTSIVGSNAVGENVKTKTIVIKTPEPNIIKSADVKALNINKPLFELAGIK